MMTMKKIEHGLRDINNKPMHKMDRGEVCYVLAKDHYVLRVSNGGHDAFLVLGDHKIINTYYDGCILGVTLSKKFFDTDRDGKIKIKKRIKIQKGIKNANSS